MPSPSGSLTSVTIMSTGPRERTAAACVRLSAATTSKPSLRSMMASSSRMDCSSSTTRMRFTARPGGPGWPWARGCYRGAAARSMPAGTGTRGSRTLTSVPWEGVLWTVMSPRCSRTMW